MRLRDVFIVEGARDAEFRMKAHKCILTVSDYVRSRRGVPDYVSISRETGLPTTIYLGDRMKPSDDIKEYFTKFRFFIDAVQEGKPAGASYSRYEGGDMITMFVNSSVTKNDKAMWKDLVTQNSEYWIKSSKEELLHEFIHLMDAHRASDIDYWENPRYSSQAVRAGDPEATRKYYTDPSEFNAYIQQYLDIVDRHLMSSKPKNWEEASELLGAGNFKQFGKMFVKLVLNGNPSFIKHMDKDLQKRMMKRLYQYWNDAQKKYG